MLSQCYTTKMTTLGTSCYANVRYYSRLLKTILGTLWHHVFQCGIVFQTPKDYIWNIMTSCFANMRYYSRLLKTTLGTLWHHALPMWNSIPDLEKLHWEHCDIMLFQSGIVFQTSKSYIGNIVTFGTSCVGNVEY